jgi:mono/diheme cytochrome c family protein
LKGGKDGPAIVPNDPDNSLLVQIQQKGGHPGMLSADELAQVIAWIKAGAPEQGGAPAEPGAATTPTPAPTTGFAAAQWSDFAAIFTTKCAACHVNASMGDLSLKTYADAVKGGKDGPGIVPNDPDKSMIVQVQQKGGHAGQLSADELAALIAWIKAGAPETSSGAAPSSGATPSAGGDAWTGGIDQLVNAKCAACHVNSQSGGLSLKTYADALKGGKDGPAIVPNDPDKSLLVQIQQKGGHPGQFTPEEIDRIVKWIETGAPETASVSGSTPAATPAPAIAVKNWAEVSAIFTAKCTMCHIDSQAGNLSLKTYQDALKGGQSGPAIVPGDSAKSVLVKTQQGTAHPALGMLTAEELAAIIAWIDAGAPEK